MSQSVKDVLIAARKKIENPWMWGKGARGRAFARGLETCCAAEAIEDTSHVYELRTSAYRALERAAIIGQGAIIQWNDDPGRHHSDVLAAFDKAIAECAS